MVDKLPISLDTEHIQHSCHEYNIRAERNGLNSRIEYNSDTNELYLGRIEQFKYNTYQCVLANTYETCKSVADSMVMQICFDYGE